MDSTRAPCRSPPTAGAVNFCVTTGNNLGVVGLATGSGGWAVTITNNNLTTPLVTCAIFINTAVLTPAGPGGGPPPQQKGAPLPFHPQQTAKDPPLHPTPVKIRWPPL